MKERTKILHREKSLPTLKIQNLEGLGFKGNMKGEICINREHRKNITRKNRMSNYIRNKSKSI